MSKDFFKVKKGLNLDPTSSASIASPEVGDIIVDSSDNNKLKRYDDVTASWKDVGSGVGGINYISSNSDFEGGTVGYATYADAAGEAPVDGTGGTANITFTATAVTPLRGTKSGLITKDAVNRQGQGVSYDFTIDSADQAQVLRISFDYNTEVSTINYADGDIRVYVYDVTNSRLIEVIDRDLLASSKGKFVGTFQTSPDSLSYRLIFHVASVNASAYSVEIDNIIVGPQTIVKGAIVTDWEPCTVTWTNIPGTVTSFMRRIGDSVDIKTAIAVTSAATGSISFSAPNGISVDTSKLLLNEFQANLRMRDQTGSTASYTGIVSYNGGTFQIAANRDTVNTGTSYISVVNASAAIPITWASGDFIEAIVFGVPIQGWSSNVVLSEDAGNREIVFKSALQNPTSATFDGTSNLIFPASLIDTAAGYNSSTGVYTIPESGIYYIKGSVLIGGTEANNNKLELRIYNGATIINVGANTIQNSGLIYQQVNASTLYQFNKGDTVSLRVLTEITSPSIISGVQYHTFEIAKRSSPQTIAASEVVACRYTSNSGLLMVNGVNTPLTFNLKEFDTHNAFDGTTFTAPQSGYYQICENVQFGGNTAGTGQVRIWGTTSVGTSIQGDYFGISASIQSATMSKIIYLPKGSTIATSILQSNGANRALVTDSSRNSIEIIKVG